MVSVYLRDEVLMEVMEVAREKNEDLKREGKKKFITTGKVVAEILEEWYQKRMERGGGDEPREYTLGDVM